MQWKKMGMRVLREKQQNCACERRWGGARMKLNEIVFILWAIVFMNDRAGGREGEGITVADRVAPKYIALRVVGF